MGFTRLAVLSVVMFCGTAVAAYLPTRLNLNPRSVRLVSLASTGILIGAALAIVIPEGVEAVYSSQELLESAAGAHASSHHLSRDEHQHHHSSEDNASWIGGMLLAGFIFMYVVESAHSHSAHAPSQPRQRATVTSPHIPTPLSRSRSSSPGVDDYEWAASETAAELGYGNLGVGGAKGGTDSHASSPKVAGFGDKWSDGGGEHLSTVVGLLAHSLADGLSLGASALGPTDADSSLALIVFIAIMLHKGPTAFALSSLLLSSSASPAFVRRSLFAFALSAPLAAIATYVFLSSLGASGGAATGWWTGMALVFSGGTFLYVAVQVNGKVEQGEELGAGQAVGERTKMAVVLGGMVTPALLSKLVGHGH